MREKVKYMPKRKTTRGKALKGALSALGAAAIGAAAIALSNKKTRGKIKKLAKSLEKEGVEELDKIIAKVEKAKKSTKRKLRKS